MAVIVEGDVAHMVADRVASSDKNNHIFEKCWEKFGHLEWPHLVDADSGTLGEVTILLQPLSLVLLLLPVWYYHRTSMIDYDNSSSLRAIIQ